MKVKVVSGKRGKYLLRWVDKAGKTRERTTKLVSSKSNLKDALKIAAKLEEELCGNSPPDLMLTTRQRKKVDENWMPQPSSHKDGGWEAFKLYYFQTHLKGLSDTYGDVMRPILSAFEKVAKPENISDVDAPMVRKWFASLRENHKSPETIKSYWGHLRSFLSIALDDGLILKIPRVRLPKSDRKSLAKGRPINLEEFERMIENCDKLPTIDVSEFSFFMWGLWLGGLRISEAHRLTWDESGFYVDLEREYPMFVIREQKNKRKQMLPMAPEYAEHLDQVPSIRRTGFVYKLRRLDGKRLNLGPAKRRVAKCGEKAKVRTGDRKKVTKTKDGKSLLEIVDKTATAHDLRRSFAQRWALKVLPQVLQQLMRHQSIETTMKYYAQINAETLATQIYLKGGQKGGQSRKTSTA